jgi:hypothetical protein
MDMDQLGFVKDDLDLDGLSRRYSYASLDFTGSHVGRINSLAIDRQVGILYEPAAF